MPKASSSLFSRFIERAPAIRRVILLGLVGGIPIAFLRITLDPFNVPKLVLLGAGVSCALALRAVEILQGRSWRGLDLVTIPAALIAVPLTLSWSLSPYREWAIFGFHARFQGLVPYVLVILLGILIADAFRGRAEELAIALLWSGAIVGGYAVIQTIGADPFDWSLFGAPTESISTTGNPNFTGGFLGIVLPVGLGVLLSDPGRRKVTIRLMVLAVAGWLVARSQGGWAAGVAGSAIVAGYHFRDRYRLAQVAAWAVAGIVTLTVIGVVLVAMIKTDSRFTTSASLVRSRWSQAAFDMGLAHPLVGRGPNSFAIEGVRHRNLEDAIVFNFDFPDDPHSVPMSMFANLGIPGLIGFVGLFVWALRFFFRSQDPRLLQVAFTAAVVAYFVQSLVSIDELTLRVGLWAVLGGLVASSSDVRTLVTGKKGSTRRSPRKPLTRMRAPLGVALVGLALLGSIAWAASMLVADVFARQGSRNFSAGDLTAGHSKYESALSLRDSADYHARLAFGLKALAIDNEQGVVNREVLDMADEEFSFTQEVPYVFSIVSHARLLEEAAQLEKTHSVEAVALYQRALRLDPLNPLIRVELAHVLLRVNQPDDALDALIDLREVIGNRVPEYWGALALSAARAGELTLAQEAVDTALSLSPTQPDATSAAGLLDEGDA